MITGDSGWSGSQYPRRLDTSPVYPLNPADNRPPSVGGSPLRSGLNLQSPFWQHFFSTHPGTGGALPPNGGVQAPSTGGVLPPNLFPNSGVPPYVNTGGVIPPYRTPTGISTGGPMPSYPVAPAIIGTGGPIPPTPVSIGTGGPLPPTPITAGTGGNLPPTPIQAGTGGNLPPTLVGPTNLTANGSSIPNVGAAPAGSGATPTPGTSSFAPADVVNQTLSKFLDGPYAADARRRGIELANQRGLLNSGMAAGNSERSALEAVQPFVQQAMGLTQQREDNAFRSDLQSQGAFQQDWLSGRNFDRSFSQDQYDNAFKSQLQSDSAFQQEWLNSNNFNRSFYQQMAQYPMESASQLTQMMAQYALENPDVYTPGDLSGLSQFFNNNLQQIMSQYFGSAGGTS